jgi:hypothetical protein
MAAVWLPRRLDIDDDRRLQVDQVVVRVGKEGMSFVRAGSLYGRIRLRDELRYHLARRAPSSLIQGVEIWRGMAGDMEE